MKAGIDRDRIDPEFLLDLAEPIEAVYEAIEHDLLVNVARRFRGGVSDNAYLSWDAKMLAQLGALTQENLEIIASYMGGVDEMTKLALRTALDNALDAVEPELAKTVVKPSYVPTRTQTATRIMEAYQAQAINRLNMVNTVMLNSSLDTYRKTVSAASADYEAKLAKAQAALNEETGAVAFGSKTRREAVNAAVKHMAGEGLTGFTDARGRRWSAQAYVNMDVRTTTANAAREATMQRGQDYGCNLVAVSSHMGARPLCEPYQGRIYSTDGTSGFAYDLHGNAIPYSPISGTSYGEPAGLFGINCGHTPYPFVDGVSVQTFKPYDKEANDEAYRMSQVQRYMERKVRAAKTEADVLEAAGDTDGAKTARKKAQTINKELKTWCDENGRAYKADRVALVRTGASFTTTDFSLLHSKDESGIIDKREYPSFISPDKKTAPITDEYRTVLEKMYSAGTKRAREVYDKYVPEGGAVISGNVISEIGPFYLGGDDGIVMNFEQDMSFETGKGRVWYHEHGHYIDDKAGHISDNRVFRAALKNDFEDYVIGYTNSKGLTYSEREKAYPGMRQEILNLPDLTESIVSDLFGGLTGNKLCGNWAHDNDYWQYPSQLTDEAFAHMFCASFDKETRKYIRHYFPSSYQIFQRLLGEIR